MKKVLLIGDSIRQGYDKYVKEAFDGIAEIYYPKENCRFAAYVVRNLHEWRWQLGCGDDVDLVHWNAGLWEDLILPDGKHLTELSVYCDYVERVYGLIKLIFPKAKIVFATSTPIQEELYTGRCKRYNKDTELYNEKAVEIALKHGAKINDLYSIVEDVPKSYYSDLTHLYTREGAKILSEPVISIIEKELGIKANKVDYDKYFSKNEEVIGV